MKLVPLEDRVIILPEEAPKTSKGGVLLPDRVRERESPKRGQVLAVGPGILHDSGRFLEIASVKVGDVVVYGEYAGFDYQEGDRKLKIVRISEVQAKVEP